MEWHVAPKGLSTQRSHRCEQMPPGFLPCSFPCLLASQPHRRSLHLHLNPSLLFSSSAAAALLQHHLRLWGCKQTLPLRRATLGTVLCSGAITKSCLHRRQQLLINFQRWNLWHKLLKLWFKSIVKNRSGRDRNLIHPSQLPLPGFAAWKGKGAHETQQHFQTSAASRPLPGPSFWEAPSTCLPKIHPLWELSSTKIFWQKSKSISWQRKIRSNLQDWEHLIRRWTHHRLFEQVPELMYLKAGSDFWRSRDLPLGSWRLLIRDCIWNTFFLHQLLIPAKSEEVDCKIHVVKVYFALFKYLRISFVNTKNSSNHWCFLKGIQLSLNYRLLHQSPNKTISLRLLFSSACCFAHENHPKMVLKNLISGETMPQISLGLILISSG